MLIAPSILDADFSRLQQEVNSLRTADRIHLDIMDGKYVPSTSFEDEDIEDIRFPAPIEVHLMVDHPEQYFDDYLRLRCMGITFHIENTGEIKALELLEALKDYHIRAGICVDGYTDVSTLSHSILEMADQILLMSVKAGKGGQSFMEEVIPKIKYLREKGFTGEIEVDGGINLENAARVKAAGADIVVVGSGVMKLAEEERESFIEEIHRI